jgi:hypothetical protein
MLLITRAFAGLLRRVRQPIHSAATAGAATGFSAHLERPDCPHHFHGRRHFTSVDENLKKKIVKFLYVGGGSAGPRTWCGTTARSISGRHRPPVFFAHPIYDMPNETGKMLPSPAGGVNKRFQ